MILPLYTRPTFITLLYCWYFKYFDVYTVFTPDYVYVGLYLTVYFLLDVPTHFNNASGCE